MTQLAAKLFPHLYCTAYSYVPFYSCDQLNLYKALASEQGFRGLFTDLNTVYEYSFFDKHTICSINFPYMGISYETVLQSIRHHFPDLQQTGGIATSLKKFDVVHNRWNRVREFIKLLGDINHQIFVSLDVGWSEPDALSQFFSLLEPFPNLLPLVSAFHDVDRVTPSFLLKLAMEAKNSSLKPVMLLAPPPRRPEFLMELIQTGFDSVGVPAKLAITYITSI
jgi:hypothetical protein